MDELKIPAGQKYDKIRELYTNFSVSFTMITAYCKEQIEQLRKEELPVGVYSEVEGNLISMALSGEFDAIAHGCNCFCTMKSGIAVQMAKTFHCDEYPLEDRTFQGDGGKLGRIEAREFTASNGRTFSVINAYTQYKYVRAGDDPHPLNYNDLRSCMKEINERFSGLHIGLPKIGAGKAGGDWNKIREIIKEELQDCRVTVIIFKA